MPTTDPLGPAVKSFEALVRQYRSQVEQSRSDWNDQARRPYDARFGTRVDVELGRLRDSLASAQQMLQRSAQDAESAETAETEISGL